MKKLAIGIDIGGINTAFGLVDEQGDLFAESVISTRKYPFVEDYPTYVNDLAQAIRALIKSLSFEFTLVGIGIGAPNANIYSGMIEQPANLWKFREEETDRDEQRRLFPLAEDLSKAFGGVKALITNDANAATIGEMVYGNAKGMKDFIVITLGTGLGSGIVVGGNLLYGHDGYAGEAGHMTVVKNGRECGCGRKGCLECYASSKGIRNTAIELLEESDHPSKLRNIAVEHLSSKDISLAAKNGDTIAKKCFEFTGSILGEALANLVAVTSPQAIFLSGGVANAKELILAPTRRAMEKNILPLWKGRIKLTLYSL